MYSTTVTQAYLLASAALICTCDHDDSSNFCDAAVHENKVKYADFLEWCFGSMYMLQMLHCKLP